MKGKKVIGLTYSPRAGGKFRCNKHDGNWPLITKHPVRHRRMFEPTLLVLINKQRKKEEEKVQRAFKPRLAKPILSPEPEPLPVLEPEPLLVSAPEPQPLPVHLRYRRKPSADEMIKRVWRQGRIENTVGL